MKNYVPIFFDFLEATQDLSDEECGRLIKAVLLYAAGQEYDHLLPGQEKIAFRFLKGQVDRNAAISESRSRAGAGKNHQTRTDVNKTDQNGSNSPKEKENKNKNKNENIIINENRKEETAKNEYEDVADEEAFRIQEEQNQVLTAAENAGFPRSNMVRAKLIDCYARYGMEKVCAAISSCAVHSVTTIAYLEAVLKAKPRESREAGKLSEEEKQKIFKEKWGGSL